MRLPFLSRPKTPAVERRRQLRLRTRGDSYVRIDGRDVPLINWSEEGFLAGPYAGGLIAGQKAMVRIVVRDYHDRTGTLDLNLPVVVKRVGRPGLAARFSTPERYKRQALQSYYAAKRAEVKKT